MGGKSWVLFFLFSGKTLISTLFKATVEGRKEMKDESYVMKLKSHQNPQSKILTRFASLSLSFSQLGD